VVDTEAPALVKDMPLLEKPLVEIVVDVAPAAAEVVVTAAVVTGSALGVAVVVVELDTVTAVVVTLLLGVLVELSLVEAGAAVVVVVATHWRSDWAVGATLSTSPAAQTVRAVQVLSLVFEAAALSYWSAVQTVWLMQTVSEMLVAAETKY